VEGGIEACVTLALEQRDVAAEHACSDEYGALLECLDGSPIECEGADGTWEPGATAACAAQRGDVERCLPVLCPAELATCRPGAFGGGLACICSATGEAPGSRFAIDACDELESRAAEECSETAGTCNATFCPPPEEGVEGCCITGNGPCGGLVDGECVEWSEGSCASRFCPPPDDGAPGEGCCLTANGPCGVDRGDGAGCVGETTPDAGQAPDAGP
jgi:hypothetical protein